MKNALLILLCALPLTLFAKGDRVTIDATEVETSSTRGVHTYLHKESNEPLDGEYRIVSPNGDYLDIEFKKGIADGKFFERSKEGVAVEDMSYDKGLLKYRISYHSDGITRRRYYNLEDEKSGRYSISIYDNKNNLIERRTANNWREDERTTYYPSGSRKEYWKRTPSGKWVVHRKYDDNKAESNRLGGGY